MFFFLFLVTFSLFLPSLLFFWLQQAIETALKIGEPPSRSTGGREVRASIAYTYRHLWDLVLSSSESFFFIILIIAVTFFCSSLIHFLIKALPSEDDARVLQRDIAQLTGNDACADCRAPSEWLMWDISFFTFWCFLCICLTPSKILLGLASILVLHSASTALVSIGVCSDDFWAIETKTWG